MLLRKNLFGARRGVLTVLVAVLLVAILGVVAIVLDGGMLQENKRRVQSAADAAALAAATELFRNYPAITLSNFSLADPDGKAAAAALANAKDNGFSNDGETSKVEVHVPPKTGLFAGKVGYAEVVVTYYQPRYFSTIWGQGTLPVVARAVSHGRWGANGNGVIVLDPTTSYALDASGTGSVTVTGGAAMVVNSNNVSAARATGGGTLTANLFQIVGNYSGSLNGPVQTGTLPIPDPLRYLPVPENIPAGNMTVTHLPQGNKQYVLSPGRYSNLPTFNPGDIVILQQASANNVGGIIYIEGGGLKSTGANITMDPATTGGVMIYNKPNGSQSNQGIQITGNSSGSVNLSPLTSGPYAGILFWQERSSTVSASLAGNGSFTLLGTLYAANAPLQISGNGNAIIGSQYISRTLTLSGNGNITIQYSDDLTARQRDVMLVE